MQRYHYSFNVLPKSRIKTKKSTLNCSSKVLQFSRSRISDCRLYHIPQLYNRNVSTYAKLIGLMSSRAYLHILEIDGALGMSSYTQKSSAIF